MPGLLRGVARTAVVAGTATAVSNRVSRRQQGRWAEQEWQGGYAQQAPPPGYTVPAPSPPADESADRLAQLERLGKLREQGLLSDEEFAAEKRRVLGS